MNCLENSDYVATHEGENHSFKICRVQGEGEEEVHRKKADNWKGEVGNECHVPRTTTMETALCVDESALLFEALPMPTSLKWTMVVDVAAGGGGGAWVP